MLQLTQLNYPNITTKLSEIDTNEYLYEVSPLLPGYGHTLGNSLRRVMLSSIPGCAVTKIRINDITHEYQTIEGVVEDALNVILNLKKVRFKMLTDDDKISLTLTKKKQGKVLASDFNTEKKAELVNPDQYICDLSKDIELTIEVEITRGIGYLSTDKIDFAGNLDPHNLLVDALYSPVQRVALDVEKVRVGDRTDYDSLKLNFATDGSVPATEVIDYALSLLSQMYKQMQPNGSETTATDSKTSKTSAAKTKKVEVSEIQLADDILAILEKNNITTNAELAKSKDLLIDFAGLTKKHLKEIDKYISSL